MKKIFFLSLISLLFLRLGLFAQDTLTRNPLINNSTASYGAPRFDQIRIEHFMPALEYAMKIKADQVARIAAIPLNQATFENVIVPLDESGAELSAIQSVLAALKSNRNDKELGNLLKLTTPKLSRFYDSLSFNPQIFERISYLYNKRDSMNLDSLAKRALSGYYNGYVRSGALCPVEQQARLQQVNSSLALERLAHGENIVQQTENYRMIVGDKDSLQGLSTSLLQAAAAEGERMGMPGKWAFTLDRATYGSFIQRAKNRDLRRKLYIANYMRANNDDEHDNKAHSVNIINLRLERANILGYNNYADYVIKTNMAETGDNARALLISLATPAIAKAKQELEAVQNYARSIEGPDFVLEAWDWSYYAGKMRSQKFDMEGISTRQYLPLDNVRDGAFYVANRLYGITLTRLYDIPVYHPDVQTFEVRDADGSSLGLLYMDCFPRNGKRSGAWCSRLRSYSNDQGDEQLPLVTISCNLSKPTADAPALLGMSEARTIFHEFGHALAAFFARGPYDGVRGNFPRDMVELPSQLMENWAVEPEVLKVYARHYKTNEPMPDSVITKMLSTALYNEGWSTSEHVMAALLDLEWHSQTQIKDYDVNKFEEDFVKRYGFVNQVSPRYRTTYFNHIFQGSYPAQYYVYSWAAVLETDAFTAFKQSGDIFNPELAARFRKHILTEVGYDEPMNQYVKFRGSIPSVDALLRSKGFIE